MAKERPFHTKDLSPLAYAVLVIVCLIIAIVLSGCNGQGVSSSERIISSGWADVSNEDSEGQKPLYCYKTLGAVECFDTPDDRRKAQLVTNYPKPQTARQVGIGKIFASFSDERAAQEGYVGEENLPAYSPQVSESLD